MSVATDPQVAVEAERQWPAVITLKRPIDFGSEHISSLEFRRGRMGDLIGMRLDDVPPMEQVLLIASRMCNKPVAALALLEAEDGAEVLEIALRFFAKFLGAGRTR